MFDYRQLDHRLDRRVTLHSTFLSGEVVQIGAKLDGYVNKANGIVRPTGESVMTTGFRHELFSDTTPLLYASTINKRMQHASLKRILVLNILVTERVRK